MVIACEVLFIWQEFPFSLVTSGPPQTPEPGGYFCTHFAREHLCKSPQEAGKVGGQWPLLTGFFSFLKATYTVLGFIPFLFNHPPPENPFLSEHKAYSWELRLTSRDCPLLPAQRPCTASALAAGALQLLAGSTVLLETYARRLRHAIAASFFSAQETRRVCHLHARLQRRHDRHQGQQLAQPPSPL